MPVDQAEGLRRRAARQRLRVVHGFFARPESAIRLAHALHARGWTTLLADTLGRVWPDAPARSLFDWRQQIARGQLLDLPMPYGGGWHAPGVRGGEVGLAAAAHGYDCLLLDAGPDASHWTPHPGVAPTLVLEVNASQQSILQGYALIKTAASLDSSTTVGLVGDAGACARVREACERFLGPVSGHCLHSAVGEGDAFAALAVRMTSEETGRTACYKTGNT